MWTRLGEGGPSASPPTVSPPGAASQPEPPPELLLEDDGSCPTLLESTIAVETASLVERYIAFCRSLQVLPHPGVLTFLRLHLSELRPEPYRRERHGALVLFGDSDMFAFCDFILRGRRPSPIFEHWMSIDASQCSFGHTGCLMLMRVLQLPECSVHTLDLGSQHIGPKGALAVVETLRVNRGITTVRLKGSFIHDAGALCFADFLTDDAPDGHYGANYPAPTHSDGYAQVEVGAAARESPQLEELDLAVNMLSYSVCRQIQLVAPRQMRLNLKGNRVLDEVLNASSHCIGVILVIIGPRVPLLPTPALPGHSCSPHIPLPPLASLPPQLAA